MTKNYREVTGYVEVMEALREVNTFHKWILTVRLNNGDGKRINVLFWSENALSWHTKLKHNDVSITIFYFICFFPFESDYV